MDLGARVRVERRQRLVQQQQRRVSRQRAGERDPLTLSPRTARVPGHCASSRIRKRSSNGSTSPDPTRPEANVVPDVEMREERVLLEEIADTAMLRREIGPTGRVQEHRLVERDDTVIRSQQPRDDPEQRRLPAPDGPTRATVSPDSTVRSADAR